jgi:hypothetical protein
MTITSRLLSTKDVLELNMASTEYIVPAVRDCYLAMQKYTKLPKDFEGLKILENWNKRLSTLKATDTLPEDEMKQLKFDLGTVYDAFSVIVQD